MPRKKKKEEPFVGIICREFCDSPLEDNFIFLRVALSAPSNPFTVRAAVGSVFPLCSFLIEWLSVTPANLRRWSKVWNPHRGTILISQHQKFWTLGLFPDYRSQPRLRPHVRLSTTLDHQLFLRLYLLFLSPGRPSRN